MRVGQKVIFYVRTSIYLGHVIEDCKDGYYYIENWPQQLGYVRHESDVTPIKKFLKSQPHRSFMS